MGRYSEREFVSTPTKRLMTCLAHGHNHEFLTIPSVRICDRGHREQAGVDPYYGRVAQPAMGFRPHCPVSSLETAAVEG